MTRSELEVALLAASGLSSKEIANRLTLSVRTLDNHLRRVFTKRGITTRRTSCPTYSDGSEAPGSGRDPRAHSPDCPGPEPKGPYAGAGVCCPPQARAWQAAVLSPRSLHVVEDIQAVDGPLPRRAVRHQARRPMLN
ncbi:helix-turn-helix transcriptional regulator [Streptomyces sp. NPDC049597]|uniref:helix-turn-helix domain-containing protein n=1 Tax=Streptomyces sp. NPDC049597 TaxID=3155276 RepID=UPI0034470BD0